MLSDEEDIEISNDDHERTVPSPKKKKTGKERKAISGARAYNTSFTPEYAIEFPEIKPVNGQPSLFYCIPCQKNVSLVHQGRADISSHCNGPTHIQKKKGYNNNRKINTMFNPVDSVHREKVTRAEVMHTNFMVQHNISF